jgi:hypothetical protein
LNVDAWTVSGAPADAHQQTDHGAYQEHDEQYFGDAGGTDCNTAETEEGGNQGNDEEDYGVVKHDGTSGVVGNIL